MNRIIKIYYPRTIYYVSGNTDFYMIDMTGYTEFSFSPYTCLVINSDKNIVYTKKMKNQDDIEVDREFNILYNDLLESDKEKVDSIITIINNKYNEIFQQQQ